jgi:hypothetical protein
MAIKFVADNFAKNQPVPLRWSHYDIYSDFDLWDYSVESNKEEPGFISLSDVSTEGFGFYTHKWLPDGPPIDELEAVFQTAPLYIPSKTYSYVKWSADSNIVASGKITSGADGRIKFSADGTGNEFGIFDETSGPDFIVTNYFLNDSDRLLKTGVNQKLVLELFNRGGETKALESLKVILRSSDKTVNFPAGTADIELNAGQRLILLPPFEITSNKLPPAHGEPYHVKLSVDVEAYDTTFTDEIILPVLFDAPCFDSIFVDDGREIGGKAFGDGNGDGIGGVGERILLYNGQQRLRLFTNDPWIRYHDEVLLDRQIPAIWEDGFVLSSVVSIDENCPDGHIIEFTGYYETNTWNPIERNLHWGKAFIMVRNLNTLIK